MDKFEAHARCNHSGTPRWKNNPTQAQYYPTVWQLPVASVSTSRWHLLPLQQSPAAAQPQVATEMHCQGQDRRAPPFSYAVHS